MMLNIYDYKLEPSDSKDIEIRIRPNQIGDFNVKGVIVYYFGDDKNSSLKIFNIKIALRDERNRWTKLLLADLQQLCLDYD